jgi:large subunit ribosomal protein L24
MRKFHVKKGDLVVVIAGKDKGKSGKVLRVIPKEERVVVERINLVKKHLRPNPATGQGGIVEMEAPIHISNVMPICPSCNRPTRVGRKVLESGVKVRVCKRCGESLDKR